PEVSGMPVASNKRAACGAADCSAKPQAAVAIQLVSAHHSRHGAGCADAVVGDGPLHCRADEHRRVVDVARSPRTTAAAVNLVAVVLVIGDPVDVIQRAVVLLERVVVVVPKLLQTLFFGSSTLRTTSENVPPRLITAVHQAAPASPRRTATQHHA